MTHGHILVLENANLDEVRSYLYFFFDFHCLSLFEHIHIHHLRLRVSDKLAIFMFDNYYPEYINMLSRLLRYKIVTQTECIDTT